MLPQNVLEWLWHQLEFNYSDLTRAYSDITSCLETFPSLRPKTDVYTSEAGHSDLLIVLYGPLAATINNVVYGIPIEIWVLKQYPQVAPILYVRPTENMRINPGHHVDMNGRGYFEWNPQMSLSDMCFLFSDIFSRECPVYSVPAGSAQRVDRQQPPVPPREGYEQHPQVTNIMDSDLSQDLPEIPLNSRKHEALEALTDNLNRTVEKLVSSEIEVDMAALKSTRQVLDWFEKALSEEEAALQNIESSADNYLRILEERTTAARKVIASAHTKIEVLSSPDDLAVVDSPTAAQLMEAITRDGAASDTIAALGDMLAHDKINLDAFLKSTRSLARSQFMDRYLATKCVATLH